MTKRVSANEKYGPSAARNIPHYFHNKEAGNIGHNGTKKDATRWGSVVVSVIR